MENEEEPNVKIAVRSLTQKSWAATLFEPQSDPGDPQISAANPASCGTTAYKEAPERRLTLFALRLAILEKTASGIGALGFIWATVVLLGGFAITLERTDFWFITVILLIEGTRIFSRSHELEWQHQATWSLAEAGRSSFRAIKSSSRFMLRAIKLTFRPFSIARRNAHTPKSAMTASPPASTPGRSWCSTDVPYAGWVFLTRNISKMLYWLQIASAAACVSLSLMRLIEQDFGEVHSQDKEKMNRKSALNIFYGLALAEALLFLAEKTYWEWKVSYRRLLHQVNRDCDLGVTGMVSIKRFFYDSYSRCITGSIFDGLKMDLVSFAEELLMASSSGDEQLIGARILLRFVVSPRFADETLRKVGTSTPAIERLIEMLNWKSPAEEELRRSAAVIVSKLAGKKRNALRVAGIPGAMESISSLLFTGRTSSNSRPDEVSHRHVVADRANYEFSVFNLLGLLILKKLASDHDNCGKIGNTRGLLAKIVDFTSCGERLSRGPAAATESQTRAVKRSLQVVKMLVSTTGRAGKTLRQEISEIVFAVSNIRDILQYGESHIELQKLAIEILTSLAMDEEARERIGSTGGMVRELLRIFLSPLGENSVRVEAGEALAMLALESESNCRRILKEANTVDSLVAALHDPVLRINASRILANLCAYVGSQYSFTLRGVTAAIPSVLKAIMGEKTKLLEVSVGLATQVLRFTSPGEFGEELGRAGIEEVEFARRVVGILRNYSCPSIRVPRMRRFLVELSIWLMGSDGKYAMLFGDVGMERELQNVAETTSELECFNVFSGSVGLSRYGATLHSLVDTALELIAQA